MLENVGLSEFEAAEAEKVFYTHDRESVKELATLWNPEIPVLQNKPYIARAKEMQKELETALLLQADDQHKQDS